MLAGWKLTLPVAGPKGNAAAVDPAQVSPPWLTMDPAGNLVFWAPVNGTTTPNSPHARTELDRLENFRAGAGHNALTASAVVSQVPRGVPAVIVGQIHGAGDVSADAFVMLRYEAGALKVVVKQEQTGSAHTDYPLLGDVPLGTRFDFGLTDDGTGSLTFTANSGGRTAIATAPLPPAWAGATVRFQAGSYQQSDSAARSTDDDGARVTFFQLDTQPGAASTR
jgi:Alginate lyase